VRLEPIILELEREHNDLLIVAHESVLRVLYGYLMACNAADIPKLEFPRNEIIEVASPVPFSPSTNIVKLFDHLPKLRVTYNVQVILLTNMTTFHPLLLACADS
jgi:broad specificity phosphatase PhoE